MFVNQWFFYLGLLMYTAFLTWIKWIEKWNEQYVFVCFHFCSLCSVCSVLCCFFVLFCFNMFFICSACFFLDMFNIQCIVFGHLWTMAPLHTLQFPVCLCYFYQNIFSVVLRELKSLIYTLVFQSPITKDAFGTEIKQFLSEKF